MGQTSSKHPPIDSRYLAPQKLRNFNEVDLRKLRRLIKDLKLAPCCPGVDSESRELEECPICFLKYPSLNRAVCCHKPICTECFLQVKALKAGYCPMCPYCKADFSIYFPGPATAEQRRKSEAEDNEQALALERSRKGEQERSPHAETQQLLEVPSCFAPCQQATQSASASMVKLSPQTVNTGLDLQDFLPLNLFMAEAIQSEGDLDDVMLMQGISASLQHPNQFTALSSSTPAPHDSCHPSSVPLPSQLESDVHAVQQASRATSGSALAPAEFVQSDVCTGVVVGHSTGWQDHPEDSHSSQGEGWLQIPGRRKAAASHSTAASTSSNRSCMPSSSSQSDGTVTLSVKSADTQPSSQIPTPSTAVAVQSSSRGCPQLGSPHKPPAISSGCTPWDLPLSSSVRKSGRVQAGVGDTLAAFLQEQTKAPNVEAQAILPQPASGTHELLVGMVTTDFTLVPSAGQQHSNGSCQTDSQSHARQCQNSSPACLLPTAASSCVGALGKRPGYGMAADCKQELCGGQVARQSMEPCVDDLSGGAVMLQNPDGSVQYVVLTSDEQRAVQLSIQAKRNKEAGTAETSTYHVECSPEDQAVQAAVAEGDAILQRLYQVPQNAQQRPVAATSAGSETSDTADRSTSMQYADPMLRRMEEADAKLRALYSSDRSWNG